MDREQIPEPGKHERIHNYWMLFQMGGLPAVINKAVETETALMQIIKYQEQVMNQQQAELQQLKEWIPAHAIATPLIVDENTNARELLDAANPDGQIVETTWDNSCLIDATFGIRYGPNPQDRKVIGLDRGVWSPYHHTQAEQHIKDHAIPLLTRGAMVSELRGQRIPGVSDKVLSEAINELAEYHYNPDLKQHLSAKRLEVFDRLIWPNVDKKMYKRQDVLKIFRKSVRETFQLLERPGERNHPTAVKRN